MDSTSLPVQAPDDAGVNIAEHDTSEQLQQSIHGSTIAKILSTKGPVVKCVILRAPKTCHLSEQEEEDSKPPAMPSINNGEAVQSGTTKAPEQPSDCVLAYDQQQQEPSKTYLYEELVEEIQMDTTPSKNEVSRILGGPFTFVGQYEDEGIILMARQGYIVEDATAAAPSFDNPEAWEEVSVSQLRSMCREQDICMDNMPEKNDLIVALKQKLKDVPPFNPHPLQPPFHDTRIRGDILVLKVAQVDDPLDEDEDIEKEEDEEVEETFTSRAGENYVGEDARDEEEIQHAASSSAGGLDERGADIGAKGNDNETEIVSDNDDEDENDDSTHNAPVIQDPTNEEFFLDYTKEEYLIFSRRTDVVAPTLPEQAKENELGEGDNDGEYNWGEDMDEMTEDEEKSAMLNIVMSELLRKFREENGRGPETRELLDMRAAVAEQLGVEVTTFDDAHWEAEEARSAEQAAAAEAAAAATGEGASRKRAATALVAGGDETLEDGPERKRVKFEKQLVTSEVRIDYSEEAAVHSKETSPSPLVSMDDQRSSALERNPTSDNNSPGFPGMPKSDDP